MCRLNVRAAVLLAVSLLFVAGCSQEPDRMPQQTSRPAVTAAGAVRSQDGEALFRQFCANCHPDGGNVSDPRRSLRGSVLRANHITTADDIVRIMRNPISRMIRFDAATLPDRDALAIAEYVLTTFK